MSDDGLLRATANAVLALYGLPEPDGPEPVGNVAATLNALAYERRAADRQR